MPAYRSSIRDRPPILGSGSRQQPATRSDPSGRARMAARRPGASRATQSSPATGPEEEVHFAEKAAADRLAERQAYLAASLRAAGPPAPPKLQRAPPPMPGQPPDRPSAAEPPPLLPARADLADRQAILAFRGRREEMRLKSEALLRSVSGESDEGKGRLGSGKRDPSPFALPARGITCPPAQALAPAPGGGGGGGQSKDLIYNPGAAEPAPAAAAAGAHDPVYTAMRERIAARRAEALGSR